MDFLESCWAAHVEGPVRRILEPACGTGRILRALAERGYDVVGYDRSPEMVSYAAQRLGSLGGKLHRGDMATFRPPGRFDVALNLVNSIGYLLEERDVAAHLERVAEALRPGAIYIVQFSYGDEPPELAAFGPWANRRGDIATELTWRVIREDPAARRSYQECRIVADRGGEVVELQEEHVLRYWTHDEFDRVVAASPFELSAIYHDRFDPFPIDEARTGEHGNLYHVLARRG
jgi:SAM-dependent methyltransferase